MVAIYKRSQTSLDLGSSQKERLAESIAYWMIKNGLSDASVNDVDLHLIHAEGVMDVCEKCGAEVRKFLPVEHTSLLRATNSWRIDFLHRSLQEYLAALAAVEENDRGLLLNHALDDQWRETIIMAVEFFRQSERENSSKT